MSEVAKPSRRAALVMLAGASALAAIPPLAASQGFDAAAYVKMWRDAGNETSLIFRRSGAPLFGFYNPRGMEMPSDVEQAYWGEQRKAHPDWKARVLDFLMKEDPRPSAFDLDT
jgi:hypothetical protein